MPGFGTILIAALVLAVAAPPPADLRHLFERARLLDETNRELDEAIRLYRAVADGAAGDRELAARALHRLGLVYERRGRQAEAQRAFSELVTRYADSGALARKAAAKLAEAKKTRSLFTRGGRAPDDGVVESFTFPEGGNLLTALDETRGRLYVMTSRTRASPDHGTPRTIYEKSHLVIVDTRTHVPVGSFPMPSYVDHVALDRKRNLLYGTAQMDGAVLVFDAASGTLRTIAVPGLPTGIAVSASLKKVFVASQGFGGNDRLFTIESERNRVDAGRELGGVGGAVYFNEATNRVYALATGRTLVFDGRDGSLVASLDDAGVIHVDPLLNRVYAMTQAAQRQSLDVLDGTTHQRLASLPLWSPSPWIASDHTRRLLYVGLGDRRQLAVVDTRTNEELGRYLVRRTITDLVVESRSGHLNAILAGESPSLAIYESVPTAGHPPLAFSDEFESLDEAWVRFGGAAAAVHDGKLRIHAGGDGRRSRRRGLLRAFRGADWMIEVKGTYFTGTNGGTRTLFLDVLLGVPPMNGPELRRDPPAVNAVRLARAREDWNGCCPGDVRQNFVDRENSAGTTVLPPPLGERFWWRIARNGRTVTIERTDDGVAYSMVASHTYGHDIDYLVQALVIGAESYASSEAWIEVDWVRLQPLKKDSAP